MGKYSVPALEKTIAILNLISSSQDDYTITELCNQLELPKATVFTIMRSLESHRFVEKDRNGHFYIGPKLYQLGMTYALDNSIVEWSKPYLLKLMEETGFTVHLGVLEDTQIMYIAKVEPENFIKFSTYAGMTTDMHTSSLGKAIAAYLDKGKLNKILQKTGLPTHTNKSITSEEDFHQALQLVQEQGYAVEDEEGELGVRCIGAPILKSFSTTPTAISVTAPLTHLPPEKYETIGKQVQKMAEKLSSLM